MKKIFNTKTSRGLLNLATFSVFLCMLAFTAAAYHRAFIDGTLTPIIKWGFAYNMLCLAFVFEVTTFLLLFWLIMKRRKEKAVEYQQMIINK